MFRKRRKSHPLFLLLLGLLIICIGFFLMEFRLRNTFIALAESKAQWKATETIHTAILEEIGSKTSYEDLIHLEKDNNNRIIFMEADILEINQITSRVTLNIQREFEKLKTEEFDVPMGQLTDSMLLASFGPHVNFKLLPVGTVEVSPEDSFQEAGINQTRHKICLNVKGRIKVVIPFTDSLVDINLKVPIADAVIVGNVPETYLEFSGNPGQGFSNSD